MAKAKANSVPLDRQIDLQIQLVDRLTKELERKRSKRLSFTKLKSLVPAYEQLVTAKAELANLQLQHLNQSQK